MLISLSLWSLFYLFVVFVVQVPPVDAESLEPVQLETIVELVTDPTGLSSSAATVLQALAPQLFLFHPLERGPESWLKRAAVLDLLASTPCIKNPSTVIKVCSL